MKYAEGDLGRVFVLRLEDGDRIPDAIEDFAAEQGVSCAACWLLGGVGNGRLVVGPEDGDAVPPQPMLHTLRGVHEAAAVGTLFPDESGKPSLHMHAALGRRGETRTGCVRPGLDVWVVGEVVLLELLGMDLLRRPDPETGFTLLDKPQTSE